MRMLKKDVGGKETPNLGEDFQDAKPVDPVQQTKDKDNILGFITEARHGMHVIDKALGYQDLAHPTQMKSKKADVKRHAMIEETPELRSFL